MPKKDAAPDKRVDQESLREELMGRFSSEGFGLETTEKREVSVMARMNVKIVEIIDALVELDIFHSRSEAVAVFVERMISSRRELFEEIRNQAQDIRKKREASRHLAYRAMQADRK